MPRWWRQVVNCFHTYTVVFIFWMMWWSDRQLFLMCMSNESVRIWISTDRVELPLWLSSTLFQIICNCVGLRFSHVIVGLFCARWLMHCDLNIPHLLIHTYFTLPVLPAHVRGGTLMGSGGMVQGAVWKHNVLHLCRQVSCPCGRVEQIREKTPASQEETPAR